MSQEDSLATLQKVSQSSIEIRTDSKGTYSWTIKRYFDQDQSGASDAALNEIEVIDARLRDAYQVPQ